MSTTAMMLVRILSRVGDSIGYQDNLQFARYVVLAMIFSEISAVRCNTCLRVLARISLVQTGEQPYRYPQ